MPPQSAESRAKNWCFTIHNQDSLWMDEDVNIQPPEDVCYVVYGRETCPETGRIHLQGYLQLKTKKRFAQVSAMLDASSETHAFVEKAKGNFNQNFDYCTKEGAWVSWGNPNKGTAGGQNTERTDINLVRDMINEGASLEELIACDEVCGTVARCMPFVRQHIANYKAGRGRAAVRARMVGAELREWQSRLAEVVTLPPSARKVMWYWDGVGNTGKSFMVDYLIAMNDAIVFTHGKVHDIAHAYNGEKIVCFDLARTQEEKLDAVYMTLECLKNGRIFSGKYESTTKVFEVPHVIVFANFAPDKTKLSADRWDVHEIIAAVGSG